MANKGKLHSTLGVDGYNPSAIQYDDGTDEPSPQKTKKSHTANVAKIDEYIKKVSSYRAGGDGGKCLKILKAYVGNVADNPGEDKFFRFEDNPDTLLATLDSIDVEYTTKTETQYRDTSRRHKTET